MRRYLVVANQTLGGENLIERIRQIMAGGPCRFHIVVPATPPGEQLTWTEGQAVAIAQTRLDRALARFRVLGAEASGAVGDKNPILAIEDALRDGEFDEIVLSTLPPGGLQVAEAGPSLESGRALPTPGDAPCRRPGASVERRFVGVGIREFRLCP